MNNSNQKPISESDMPYNILPQINEFCVKSNVSIHSFFISAFKILVLNYQYETEIVNFNTTIKIDNSIINENLIFQTLDNKNISFINLCHETEKLIDINSNNPLNISIQYIFELKDNEDGKNEINITIDINNTIKISTFSENNSKYTIVAQHSASHFNNIITEILQNPDLNINTINIIPINEDKLINEYSAGTFNPHFSSNNSLIALFQKTAREYPDNIAIQYLNTSITYRQLDEYSTRFAEILRKESISSGGFVGLLMRRNIDTFISMLSILKSGNAYIPLDPSYPKDRILYILDDCKAELLITSSEFQSLDLNENNTNTKIIFFDKDVKIQQILGNDNFKKEVNDIIIPDLDIQVSPESLAYAIYTSGTTGMPKGVKISNASICNLIQAESLVYKITPTDKVIQGFSIAFDASLEEIWMAFYSGATLVIAPETVMKSGQEITKYLNEHKITVFSTVPTLLSVLEEEIPTLRVLILGGEVCSKELINRWCNNNRHIFNTYGPTEATVVASYFECEYDKDVNIGKPLINYSMYILNKDHKKLPIGIAGEICIGGLSLSDGYINNEKLNKTKFIRPDFAINPNFPQRLYSTGDLGRLNDKGEIEYLGRIDTQVKIRGYRVELSEIESQLLMCNGVKSVAVAVKKGFNGIQNIVAYILETKDNSFEEIGTKEYIKKKLPPYMIPSKFIILKEFPTLPSGKIDRNKLPDISMDIASNDTDTTSFTQTEKKVFEVWRRLFSINNINLDDDFFDLGGHSLLASQMISELRKDPLMNKLSVKDIYTHLTIKKLSEYIDSLLIFNEENENQSKERKNTKNIKQVSKLEKFIVTFLQTLSIVSFYGLISTFIMMPILIGRAFHMDDFHFYLMTIFTLLSAFPILIVISILIKWIVIGKFKEGNYPLWSFYYFRFWFVKKFVDFVPLSLLTGSPFLSIYYRMMGAKIGKNVFIGSDRIRAFDLVTIGDNSSISKEAYLMGYKIENNTLYIGKIEVGKKCYVGPRALLSLYTEMSSNSSLMELSMLPEKSKIPSEEVWKGSPAKFQYKRDDLKNKNVVLDDKEQFSTFKTNLIFLFAVTLIIGLPLLLALPIADTLFILEEKIWLGYVLMLTVPAATVYVIMFCLSVAALKWILIGKQKPNDIPVKSYLYIRKWIVDTLLQLNLLMLKSIYATIFLPYWLRLMGSKIGKRAEISTVNQISVDMLEIGDESFLADSVNVGAPLVFDSIMKLRTTKVGKRTFIGNSAVLPTGSSVADNSLIGVLSIPPGNDSNNNLEGTSWLGSPPMFLPKRQESYKFPENLTYNPSVKLYIIRGIIEYFKITVPYALEISLFGIFYYLVFEFLNFNNTFETLAGSTIIFTLLSLFSIIPAIISKKLLINRYKQDVKPLWSYFVWKNEFINSINENFVFPFLQNLLLGTPYAPFFFRLMGCKIGKNVFMETTEITEFDLVNIGDNSTLNFGCTIQTHLFEDRVMKMSQINIGSNCNVGPLSVVLYDTNMGNNSSIQGLSLLMKGETLPDNTIWQGSPVKFSHNL